MERKPFVALVPSMNLFRVFGASSRFPDSKGNNEDRFMEVEGSYLEKGKL